MVVQKFKKLCRSRLVKVIAGGVLVFLLFTLLENNIVIYKTSHERDRLEFEPIHMSPDLHDHDDTLSHNAREESQAATANQSTKTESHDLQNCMVIHISVQCTGADQVRQVVFLMRTLLFHRSDLVVLHVMTDDKGRLTLQTLLDTWKLRNLEAIFYHTTTEELSGPETLVTRRRFYLHQILPTSVTKVIVLDHRMRFTSNIRELWNTFSLFSEIQMVGIVSKPGLKDASKKFYIDLLLLDLHKIRHFRKKSGYDSLTDWQTWQEFQEAINLKSSLMYILPCQWLVRIERHFDFNACIHGTTEKAIWLNEDIFTRNRHFERLKEYVFSILSSSVDISHEVNTECRYLEHKTSPTVLVNVNMTDPCAEFRFATQLPRRTHLYYVDNEVSPGAVKNNDVTLVTQLTIDRFLILEHMVSNWDGPLVVVVYANDEEALSLPHRVSSSEVIKKRKNIVFHIVYKRQIFYPINYLRNVGISNVNTPYTVVIDVDLVPSPNLYPRLLELLSTSSNTGVAWVVPAFEAFDSMYVFPSSRTDLLQLIWKKKAIGYGMKNGWNAGHKPTDYKKWGNARKPYEVQFADAFEPYVVLPSDNLPRYDERLLERMGDKISYGRHLYALGYKFMVLHDVFVLHLPHLRSSTTAMYTKYPGMFRCGAILFKEFRQELEYNMTKRT